MIPARLALPCWTGAADDRARTLAGIDAWADSAALARIVRAFDGENTDRHGAELLDWLDEFSAAHWDFRGGAERNLAPVATLPDGVERLVFESAPELGLAGPYSPRLADYDSVLMTGGMIRAEIVKPRFARELLTGGLKTTCVVFLGGFRAFAGDELDLAPVFGVRGDNEFEAMVHGMELAFGPLGEPEVTGSGAGRGNSDWRVCSWRIDGLELRVVAAPSSDPEHRRANTADTYRFWADRVRPREHRSVLVITTPIYVPYQGAGAVEILGLEHGLSVETIGASGSASDLGEHSQRYSAQNHLQEIRSAIRALRSLRFRLTTGDQSGTE